jgi:hypothetical protein
VSTNNVMVVSPLTHSLWDLLSYLPKRVILKSSEHYTGIKNRHNTVFKHAGNFWQDSTIMFLKE